MNLRMKIFEGPDCCGKTTQANLLMDKMDNAILFHFPMLQLGTSQPERFKKMFDNNPKVNVKLAIKNLNETLYSDEYINSNETTLSKQSTIINHMKNNIYSNASNKMLFVLYLNKFFNSECTKFDLSNTFNLDLFDDIILRLRLNGEEITENKFEKLLEFREKNMFNIECKHKTFNIILDRFFISGRFYNLEMPLAVYKKKMCSKYSDQDSFVYIFNEMSKNLRIIYDYGEKELLLLLQEVLIKYNYRYSTSFNEQKMSFSLNTIFEIFKCSNILPFVHNYIFLPSEYIRNKVLSGQRECDAYDKNMDMKEEIAKLYTNLRNYFFNLYEDHKNLTDSHVMDNMKLKATSMPDVDDLINVSNKSPENVIQHIHDTLMWNLNNVDNPVYIKAYDRRCIMSSANAELFSL